MTPNLDPPRDPRAVLKAHRAEVPGEVPDSNPAAEHVERLLQLQGDWLRTRVQWTARNFHLSADELCQELVLGMLRRSTTVDEGNQGVRSWLSVRVKRTAIDMVRSRGRDIPAEPDDFAAFERTQAQRGRLPGGAQPVATIDREWLIKVGLTPHEAQVVALRCTGTDLNLKDFAEIVHRTHTSVRKEFERGIRKIENFFGLTTEEAIMLRALRNCGSAHAAAQTLNRPDEEVTLVLKSARRKLDRLFDEVEGPS